MLFLSTKDAAPRLLVGKRVKSQCAVINMYLINETRNQCYECTFVCLAMTLVCEKELWMGCVLFAMTCFYPLTMEFWVLPLLFMLLCIANCLYGFTYAP